jgi:glycosyltransferase involved in cell wall biosynthesis
VTPKPTPKKTVSFVIPVFRNQGSIRLTYGQIVAMMRDAYPDLGCQVVLVDDGSDDGSLEEMRATHRDDPTVECLCFSRNFGQIPAIVAGFRAARGQATVILSADLQDPVRLIADMIAEWLAGNEIVICYRISREDSAVAQLTSRVFYGLIKYTNPRMPAGGFDFVLLGEKPSRIFASFRERNRFFQGDILWMGFPTKFIPYSRQRRTIGKSQWTLAKKIKYFIDGLLNTSYLPIRLMSLLGLITSLSGFAYAVVVVFLRLTGRTPFLGYAPLMIVMLVLGGMNMIMLGIIGEYIWRIYDEASFTAAGI